MHCIDVCIHYQQHRVAAAKAAEAISIGTYNPRRMAGEDGRANCGAIIYFV